MSRYFIEVSYKGSAYAGFQVQDNANTIQAEIERALGIYFRVGFELTGSSRTDAGVHAVQNFFHFDFEKEGIDWANVPYHLNAILPEDIAVRKIIPVADDAHCRFDAVSRTYEYSLYDQKNPFLHDRAYFYPYRIDLQVLNEAAAVVLATENFESFCKRNVQVRTYLCRIQESKWFYNEKGVLVYRVRGNRFLRGMVRGLVGTMLRVGRGKTSMVEFFEIINSNNPSRVDFSTPAHGLSLVKVEYQHLNS
jgi:tRNA pseudouridine38-40 synthase